MNLKTGKLITVVAEAFVSDRIIREMLRLGASGYSAMPISGQGSRGVRASLGERKNVKIESIVSDSVVEKILHLLSEYYVPQYAVVVYVRDVEIVHGNEYV